MYHRLKKLKMDYFSVECQEFWIRYFLLSEREKGSILVEAVLARQVGTSRYLIGVVCPKFFVPMYYLMKYKAYNIF